MEEPLEKKRGWLKRQWLGFSEFQKKGIFKALLIYSGILPYFIYYAATETESFSDFWGLLLPLLIFWLFLLLFCAVLVICFTKLDRKFERDILKQIQGDRFKMSAKKPLWFFLLCTALALATLISVDQEKFRSVLIYLGFFELAAVVVSLEWRYLFSAKYLAEIKDYNEFNSDYFGAAFEARFFGLGIFFTFMLAFLILIALFNLPGWVIFLIYSVGSVAVILYVFREYKKLEMYQRLKQGKL